MKLREGMIYEIIGDSFLLGFESAYRAAKKKGNWTFNREYINVCDIA